MNVKVGDVVKCEYESIEGEYKTEQFEVDDVDEDGVYEDGEGYERLVPWEAFERKHWVVVE